jgi:hypothetical protein
LGLAVGIVTCHSNFFFFHVAFLLHAALVLHLLALTPLASIHQFLIYALIFGLTPFGWLRSVTLTPNYAIIFHENIVFDLRPLLQEQN